MAGFERGRNLDKIGLKAQDTAELFFDDVRVPAGNLLGEESRGFVHLMENLPQERLSIAVGAVAGPRRCWRMTPEYVKDRKAFGRPIGTFQHNRFVLAEMAHRDHDRADVHRRLRRAQLSTGELAAVDAAMAKWWTTDLQNKVVDRCLQLHGGYGYMDEYPIAEAYATRASRPSTAAPTRS